MAYPASVSFKRPSKNSQLWALLTIIPLKVLALIPHIIVLAVLGLVAHVLGLVGFLVVLFKGEYPKSIEKFIVGTIQWYMRASAYLFCLTDEYPPFSMEADHALKFNFKHQKNNSRIWALLTIIPVKFVLLVPHFIVIIIADFLAGIAMILGVFAVLFSGEFPKSFEKFIVGYLNYAFRVSVYALCMTDEYPPIEWK